MNGLTLKGVQSVEALLKINLNITRVELFEPIYKGDQEVVNTTLSTVQWLLQGNFNYHAVCTSNAFYITITSAAAAAAAAAQATRVHNSYCRAQIM
jgi:hypothetical protein